MKRVIITGAAGGIGTAATAELRRSGATVVGLDLTGADIDCDVRSQASVDSGLEDSRKSHRSERSISLRKSMSLPPTGKSI